MVTTEYDREANALYIRLSNKPYAYGKDLDDQRRIDYSADGTPIGVELLYVDDGIELSGLPASSLIVEELRKLHLKVFA